jgi:nitrous oxidase accessory protein
MIAYASKGITFICLTFLLSGWSAFSLPTTNSSDDLQELIHSAKPGDTIILNPGRYEGPLTIDKPVTIKSTQQEKVTIINHSQQPTLQINADQVRIIGIQIIDLSQKNLPTIRVVGNDVVLDRLSIRSLTTGIEMRDANRGEVIHTTIESDIPNSQMSDKGNGIQLYNAQDAKLAHNLIRNVYDGIYLENSDNTLVTDNQIERSRYGIHCMYTKGTVIQHNEGKLNVTGSMVMASRNIDLIENTFTKQSENVNSQGILLFDVYDSTIKNNTVDGNRIGLYIEQSKNNWITDNSIHYNFTGIKLLESEGNTISNNIFLGNVVNAQTRRSEKNNLSSNYWDTFHGIDISGDGKSDTGYAINPFFQELTQKRPVFQLFFQSPGMVFLEELYQLGRQTWAKDHSPLMILPDHLLFEDRKHDRFLTGITGTILLSFSIIIIILIRRRRT